MPLETRHASTFDDTMNTQMLLAHALETIDLLIVFLFVTGYCIPFKFKKVRWAHLHLTWCVLIAQISFGFQCPLLMYANKLRTECGAPGIRVDFQPTFTNFVGSVTSPEFASIGMMTAIIVGPFVAAYLYNKYVIMVVSPTR